jgi:hypothetical protein
MAGKLCAFIIDGRECRREMTEESSGELIALGIFRCPLGHRLYETAAGTEIRFRKTLNGDTWHFLKDCSQWPVPSRISPHLATCPVKLRFAINV